MSSLCRFRSAARHLSSQRLRSFSLAANNQESETLEPFDPRKLPTDYDPSNFDPSNHRAPPTPRVWNLVDEVSSLTLSEVADLSQILVRKINLKEPPTVVIMGAGAGGAVAGKEGAEKAGKVEEKKEEKTVFELKLEGFEAANKIKVIKEVRGFTNLGLKEAKEIVERHRPFSDRILMECVFGLVGDGFAVIAADTSAVHSILVHKSNEDKVMVLDSHKLLGASGEGGDRVQFTEYIQKNVHLYQFRNGIPLTTSAAANFTRNELATALRKNPYFVNILLAGYDKDIGPSLYYIDYIATLHKIDKGAFGYGSYFCLALMDRHYHSGMSVEEAIDLVDKCILEIRHRLVVAPPNFVIKIVDKDGAREYAWRESVKDTA